MNYFIISCNIFIGLIIINFYCSANRIHNNETELWNSFKINHRKNYKSQNEEDKKREIWRRKVLLIKKHNLRQKLGLETYSLAENSFVDYDESELNQKFGYNPKSYNPNLHSNSNRKVRQSNNRTIPFSVAFYVRPTNVVLPTSYDARNVTLNNKRVSLVTAVKNQLRCGSCWAFAGVDSISAQYMIKYGLLLNLSVQELTDCSTSWGNNGCVGGSMQNVYTYSWSLNGLLNETQYPYKANNGTCLANAASKPRFAATAGFVSIQNNMINIQAALVNQGPLAIGINAGLATFTTYSTGVYSDLNCNPNIQNHAVLLIGYGTDIVNGVSVPYWLIKNSWGVGWGINGFAKILRTNGNLCGIMSNVMYPTLK